MRWVVFFTWWGHPRMVVWCLFVALSWTLLRVTFVTVYFLPSVAEFLPGFILVPASGIYAGPAGVWGIVAGTLLGDALIGDWGTMTWFRCLAFGLGSLYAMVLWPVDSGAGAWAASPAAGPGNRAGFIRFLLAGAPICLTAAAWLSIGGSLHRLYPFAYLLGWNGMTLLLFHLLFAPPVYRLVFVEWAPRYGYWREAMADELSSGEGVPVGEALIRWGSAVGCVLGILFSVMLYDVWPFSTTWLGRHAGAWVTGSVVGSLLIQVVGLALRRRTDPAPRPPRSAGRCRDYYLPPITRG